MSSETYAIGKLGEIVRIVISADIDHAKMMRQEGEVIALLHTRPLGPVMILPDGSDVVDVPIGPEEMRDNLILAAKAARLSVINGGCWTPKGEVHSDRESRATLAMYAARAAIDPSFSVSWTMRDGTNVDHAADEIVAAHFSVVDFVAAAHAKYRFYRRQIDQAPDLGALKSIDINRDWPDTDRPVQASSLDNGKPEEPQDG